MNQDNFPPTKKLGHHNPPATGDTRLLPGRNQAAGSLYEKTRLIDQSTDPLSDGTATILLKPAKKPPIANRAQMDTPTPTPLESTQSEASATQPSRQGPVCGWLAVVAGPGEGGFVCLGYGMNTIGRDADQRCRLDFGDQKISRKSHAALTYDSENRKFYIQHGGGQNLTYLASQPVLVPTELKGGEFIRMGDTVLRFVPLCGPDFEYGEHTK
jgi:hypothetical protein